MIRIQHYRYLGSKDRERLRQIYEESFPVDERFDFDILEKCNEESNVHLSCIIKNGIVVGMSFTILLPNDITYLMYLAIDVNYRNMHIGSEILQIFIEASNNLVLSVEYPTDVITRRRENFYIRNGLYDTGFHFEDTAVMYKVLASYKGYTPTSDDLLNRYRYMTSDKKVWDRIKRSFNTEDIFH